MFCPWAWGLCTLSSTSALGFGRITIRFDIGVHFSCLFITSSRTRSFVIVHLTFVSVFYHEKWFGITSLRYHFHNIDICRSDW